MHSLPFSEVIQILESPTHEELNMASYFPFQYFDDALFHDLESKEVSVMTLLITLIKVMTKKSLHVMIKVMTLFIMFSWKLFFLTCSYLGVT
jgi:hypothetical protein